MSNTVNVVIERHIATVWMNRPEVHNAFDAQLIAELTENLRQLNNNPEVRCVVLTGSGASFSAGADLNWMRGMAQASEAENRTDSLRLAELMRTLQFLSKVTIARVNGAVYGGGLGLIACCDIAIASNEAKFGLTETRLGLVPAVISPYVITAIGARHARRFFISAEIFDAHKAQQIGLIHEVVATDQLDNAVQHQLKLLKKTGPTAVREAKALTQRCVGVDIAQQEKIDARNADLIASLRVSSEGQEGLSAFLDKRPAAWVQD